MLKEPRAFLLLLMFIVLVPTSAFAQSSSPSTSTGSTLVTVATVNIYNAKVISQKNNTIGIHFDISNRVGVQSGIKYSITLVTPQGDVADEHIYSDTLALNENQTITRTITYTAPAFISGGVYRLWLRSHNDRGLPLALADLGNITFASSNTPKVDILTDTCYLTVDGEKSLKKYTLRQGVDIAGTESLVATCRVRSTFPMSKIAPTFAPTFETHFRTIYGDKVPQAGGATSSISIASGTSTISVILPKALKPQAYDVLFSLVPTNTDKTMVFESNKVNFHYVLRGLSGTVQNTVFDKLSYKKGDTALLQIFTSGSADTFEGSRLGRGTDVVIQKLDVTVTNTAGVICGSYTSKSTRLDGHGATIPIIMMEDCDSPAAQVTLGASTNVNSPVQTLDSKTFVNPLPLLAQGMTDKELAVIIAIVSTLFLLTALVIHLYENK